MSQRASIGRPRDERFSSRRTRTGQAQTGQLATVRSSQRRGRAGRAGQKMRVVVPSHLAWGRAQVDDGEVGRLVCGPDLVTQ